MKERYTVNPFPELALTEADRASLEDLANAYIMSNLELCMKFMSSGRRVDPTRWKPLKERKGLKSTPREKKAWGKLDDLMFGIISEDLETMRMKASYADSFSAAAVLDGVVMPSLEDPFRSLNRDYIYLEGIGIVRNAAGERFGYSLLHSWISLKRTRFRTRAWQHSFIAYWREIGNNTMEMYGTGIMILGATRNPRRAALPTNEAPASRVRLITGRRLGDFGKSNSTCKLCFGFVCHACKIVRKLSFVDPDLQMTQRKVTFCTKCMSEVTRMNALDIARAKC
ncbi:hypothetical protein GQ600_6248 [Phytophthora cactorum]|nr:hypothetical protein GQ600_6248 [Phytophthora cactorum]